jgi:hypothetical protein
MNNVPSIDLHPEKIGGQGPEAALMACRAFLDRSLKAGHRQVRIITGVGLRGDGTPRLRTRVEEEVLGAYFSSIEQRSYEQGGAVIKLWLKAGAPTVTSAWKRHARQQQAKVHLAGREERLMIAQDRLDAAEDALDEGDLRRCRLKLNQVAKEFGWELAEPGLNAEAAEILLESHHRRLSELDV